MYKTIFYTVIITCIIVGITWFTIGRIILEPVERSLDTVNRDFQGVQRTVSKLSANTDGFATDITTIATTVDRARNRMGTIDEGLGSIIRDFGGVVSKVGDLERWNTRRIQLDRNLGDVAFKLRRLSETAKEQN